LLNNKNGKMANFKEGDKIKVDEKEYDCVEASDGMATFVCDADFRNPSLTTNTLKWIK
jgi:hypothetical protein